MCYTAHEVLVCRLVSLSRASLYPPQPHPNYHPGGQQGAALSYYSQAASSANATDVGGAPVPSSGDSAAPPTGSTTGTWFPQAASYTRASPESPSSSSGPASAVVGARAGTLARIAYTTLTRRRSLGVGASGEVDECLWYDTPVAVKANGLKPSDAAALAEEIRLYERLAGNSHPNVVTVMGVCTDAPDGKVRLVMRLCAKGSLDNLLVKSRVEVSQGCHG